MRKTYIGGHEVVKTVDGDSERFHYPEGEEVKKGAGNKPCPRCGLNPADYDGHDPCLHNLPGVFGACCGHGVKNGYVKFHNGTIIKFPSCTISYAQKP